VHGKRRLAIGATRWRGRTGGDLPSFDSPWGRGEN
jgi:hypothetical protein